MQHDAVNLHVLRDPTKPDLVKLTVDYTCPGEDQEYVILSCVLTDAKAFRLFRLQSTRVSADLIVSRDVNRAMTSMCARMLARRAAKARAERAFKATQ